jgi:hypothetical protein
MMAGIHGGTFDLTNKGMSEALGNTRGASSGKRVISTLLVGKLFVRLRKGHKGPDGRGVASVYRLGTWEEFDEHRGHVPDLAAVKHLLAGGKYPRCPVSGRGTKRRHGPTGRKLCAWPFTFE